MKQKKGFTLIELLVVISIIALLLSILMPALSRVKDQARAVVCSSNLKQWGLIFGLYLNENNDKFSSGSHLADGSYDVKGPGRWISSMKDYYPENDNYDLFLCASAKRPGIDSNGDRTPGLEVAETAWGMLPDAHWYIEGMYGSYGFNWYAYNAKKNKMIYVYDTNNNWGNPNYENASKIPLFFDSTWINVGPFDTDTPPELEGDLPTSWPSNEMRRVCINRHNGAINMLFMDFSARKVGLKELWTLKWHKSFDTDNPYTLPDPTWPTWMQDF
jgi:prepilin-type N-terminal cleavage/methylation domain-containing protein/prepilin-type processing-associated H-X9-DG protein